MCPIRCLPGRPGRRLLCAVAAIALVLGVAACGGSSGGGQAQAPNYERALAGAPRPLAQLFDQANELLAGELRAFQRRIADLQGYPVVVNVWASWCGPCRVEFPWFQELSARFGKRIAFVGVDSDDSSAAARTFLKEYPVPYPSYSDPDETISRLLGATVGVPATAFYDASGHRVSLKQGQYASQAELAGDIRRYALSHVK